jgi:hypothetical protein
MPRTKKTTTLKVKKIDIEKPIAFEVYKANGMFVRAYTIELHGDRMEEYAQNFTKGTNMTYKPVFK